MGTRSEWRVSPDDATRFIAARFAAAGTVEVLRQGLWSSAYGFRRDGEALVIRFGSIPDDFEHDALVAAAAPPSLPVPRIMEIGEALGGWYAVSRRLPGRHMDALDATEVARVLPSLFGTLDGVRALDPGGHGYGLWDSDRNGRRATWRDEMLTIEHDDPGWSRPDQGVTAAKEALECGRARIVELVGLCPEDRSLVHSDTLHWNVLVEDDRVTGLLDWGSSLFGDFVYDIAWLTCWWPWYPQWSSVDVGSAARSHYERIGLAVPHFAERLRCYELRIGVGNLNWYLSRHDDVNLARVVRRIDELLQ